MAAFPPPKRCSAARLAGASRARRRGLDTALTHTSADMVDLIVNEAVWVVERMTAKAGRAELMARARAAIRSGRQQVSV
ncbi:hypothetical protein D6C00_14090 [Thiohalobacter thiocyanaticus]|uniref:Uncharacterized protein n=1 Tax=Thiohalobacter thiocyanaticus TaxID=585455 RepID=A0A426QMF2_9GAMM|nr:hypothetical protein D6C00_14090 [Thiohalobacter thiocyanaticus]